MPAELPDTHRRLLEELRRLKSRHGWTFAQLARKTGYSTASWQRYLSGRAMPPWGAVDALGRLASQEDGRLRALWESATAAVARQSAAQRTAPLTRNGEEAADGGPGAAPRPRSPTTLLAGLLGTALLVASSLALLSPWDAGTASRVPAPRGAPPNAPVWPWPLPTTTGPPAGAPCLANGCRGRDPYRLGCDRSSVPVHAVSAGHRTLTLRYSPVCRAVWAEVAPSAGTSVLTVSGDGGAVTAPPGDARTGMLGAAPGRARGNVNLPDRQLGVSAGTSWVVDQ
ncbi:helix-turn-helix domain-containing protein [Streptomyces cinerochromogenes]|uniref:Helix-turn-helix domain-containing protein n=1 Tax=Streptomyces cinerochromogenes TaxID=66422 RepID=A0ABW7AXE0_9ACTN